MRPRAPTPHVTACATVFMLLGWATDVRAEGSDGRFALRLEGGAGAMLSSFQRDELGFGVAWHGAARASILLSTPVAFDVGLSNWVFPDGREGTGWAFVPQGGLRVEPRVGAAGRLWIDAHAGVGLTGEVARFAFDLGLGFEFQPGSALSFGPMVRYGHMVQPDSADGVTEPFPEDARYFAAGFSIALRTPGPRQASAEVVPAAPQRAAPTPPDADGDGVPDRLDLCPAVSRGDHPDAAREGCPTPDTDFDTVLDPDDRCVTVPQGPHPDPTRLGCPAADDDGDSVLNDEDRCPQQPAGAHPDSTRPGCPDGDRDDDGVLDGADRCIDVRETYNGIDDLDGCPEADAPSAVDLDPQNHVVTLHGNVSFITGSATLVGRTSFEVLDALANLLIQHPEIELVEVQGHTDARGDRAANLALSQRRAQTVVDYLASRGVASPRLRAVGYGPDRPIDARGTVEAWTANRRTEVHVLRWTEQR